MVIAFRTAVGADLERLLPMLDQQFVFGRGRQHSLRVRFPSVYCAENAHNVFLGLDGDAILSALTIRRFDWLDNERAWQGAMAGAVWTDPARRGAGYASRTLGWAMERLREGGADFCVLWTAQPAFYARLGWTLGDRGLLGEIDGMENFGVPQGGVAAMPAAAVDTGWLEQIRTRFSGSGMPRGERDYRQIPLPAESVEAIVREWDARRSGYALIGRVGETGIVYEMIGDEECFPALWMEMVRRYRHLLVNDCEGSPSHAWLSQHTGIQWQRKPLAMWRPLSDEMSKRDMPGWYLPYFDRI